MVVQLPEIYVIKHILKITLFLAKIFPLNLKFCGLHQYECSFKHRKRYFNWDTVCFGWWMGLHCYGNWNWNWEILLGNPFPQSLHTFHGFEFHTGREYWLNIGFCLSRELQWKLFHSLCVSEYGWIYSQWQWSAWILLIFFFTLVKYFHDIFLQDKKTVKM